MMSEKLKPCPSGLYSTDTLEDSLKRADNLARPYRHSGMLCDRKDLRRIVLLAYEYRKIESKLRAEVEELKTAIMMLKDEKAQWKEFSEYIIERTKYRKNHERTCISHYHNFQTGKPYKCNCRLKESPNDPAPKNAHKKCHLDGGE
jgi:hypothetical protein